MPWLNLQENAKQKGPSESSGDFSKLCQELLDSNARYRGPLLEGHHAAALTCVCFWIIHLVMRPSSGMAAEQRRITSGVQAETCSSV